MLSEYEIKKQICEIGKRIYNKGFVAANDGNISVKISDNEILCTPTGVSKGFLTPDMICKINMNGDILSTNGVNKPSSEMKMHLGVYRDREDVKAVVHAHPIYATSYAIVGKPLVAPIMPEAVVSLGSIPLAKYGTPSTEEIPDAVSEYDQDHDIVLLENHGALSFSYDLISAYYKMEGLDFYAHLLFLTTLLGGAHEFSKEQVERLYEIRKKLGVKGRFPEGSEMKNSSSAKVSNNDEKIIEEVVKRVISEMRK